MAVSTAVVQQRLRSELSMGVRLRYTALAVVGLTMAGAMTSLVATEPALPLRTEVALTVIALGGLAWAGFAIQVLTRKRVLLASHHVTASTLAVMLTAVFALGAIVLRERAGLVAVAVNLGMFAFAVAWMLRARQRRSELQKRRAALETGDNR